MEKEVNIHAHHRSRLRKRFNTEGHLSFEEHNMLELILFYGIPYKDTNPVAHRLIQRFGSIENVLKAKKEELIEIQNVGSYTADFLHCLDLLGDTLIYSSQKRQPAIASYKSIDEMGKYLCSLAEKEDAPSTSIVFLNNSFEILGVKKLLDCASGIHLLKTEVLISEFISARASMAIIVQHKYGSIAIPDFEDVYSAIKLKHDLEISELKFLELFVVTKDDYSPVFQKSNGLVGASALANALKVSSNDGYKEASAKREIASCLPDGCSPVSDVSELELLFSLLRFASRKRAEELSHALLNKFGSLRKVLCADVDLLCEVEGINEGIATLIRLVSATKQYINEKAPPKSLSLCEKERIISFLSKLYLGENSENVLLLFFDKNQKFIDFKRISKGSSNSVFISARNFLETSVRYKASYVIMAHNHPDGMAIASISDKEATNLIRQSLSRAGIELFAHYIIANGEYTECF